MSDKYKFLNIGTVLFKAFSWISLTVGTISAIVIFVGGGTPDAPRITGLIGLLLGIVYFFVFFIASEVISLLLDIRGKLDKEPKA